MLIKMFKYYAACLLVFSLAACQSDRQKVDVLVVGGGASGTTAGIQAARLGSNTLVVEEYEWLGGALSSAGVGCVDGNYRLQGGLFGELCRALVRYYGSADSLRTGWVSNINAEPSVIDRQLKQIASQEPHLSIWYRSTVESVEKREQGWRVTINKGGKPQVVEAKVLIDGTELGDVAKACGVTYDIGMEARSVTGENIAPEQPNGIIQDLTYVAILKEYGRDVTIPQPEGYDPSLFYCTCQYKKCTQPNGKQALWEPDKMMTYGKLPNNKYMINWPIEGNDYYLNLIEMSKEEREEALKRAKNFTLCYVYYLQHELGFRTLGLADDEYPTADKLPFIPYHRESRRIHGKVRFTLNHIDSPYTQPDPYYRTAIAVGDYAVDHHHHRYDKWEELPYLAFYPVPSFGVPLGVIIPDQVEDLLVVEKSISVSNLANGATRLQPVLMQLGQAAGTLAALSVQQGRKPADIPVRDVQNVLLQAGGYLLPFLDLPLGDPHFAALQRIGATGILKGRGLNQGWANQTWFDADSLLTADALLPGLRDYYPQFDPALAGPAAVSVSDALTLLYRLHESLGLPDGEPSAEAFASAMESRWKEWGLEAFQPERAITRKEFAVLLDRVIDPFNRTAIDIKGDIIQ